MKREQIVELIERLIDEKYSMNSILASKTLGDNKQFFLDGAHKKVAKIKADLVEALGTADG